MLRRRRARCAARDQPPRPATIAAEPLPDPLIPGFKFPENEATLTRIVGFAKFHPTAEAHIRTRELPDIRALAVRLDAGATQIAPFPVTALAVKPAFPVLASRTLLVRGVGPTLGSAFGLGGTTADPELELFNNATGQKLSENNDWGGDAALTTAQASVGAFALANATSKDAVLLVTLAPGQYSARVSGADGGGGTAIVEVYEVP